MVTFFAVQQLNDILDVKSHIQNAIIGKVGQLLTTSIFLLRTFRMVSAPFCTKKESGAIFTDLSVNAFKLALDQ